MNRAMLAVTISMALAAAACGGDDSEVATRGSGADPAPSAQCNEEEPDCDDTAVDDGTGDAGSDAGTSSDGAVVDGGLTVGEALETDATGTIAVRGSLVADDESARLCDALAESMPPQCGDPSVVLAGLTAGDLESLPDADTFELQTAQGVTWTDQHVTLLGELVDGELVVDTHATR